MPTERFCPSNFTFMTSADGTTWATHDTSIRHVNPAAHARATLTYQTSAGPVVCPGRAEPTDIEVDNLYQEADTGLYAILRAAHYSGDPIHAKWFPDGGTKQWITAEAFVTSFDEPDLDADADSALFFLATLSAESIAWEDITP